MRVCVSTSSSTEPSLCLPCFKIIMTQLSKWVQTLVGDQSVVFNEPWLRVEGQSIDTVCEGVRGSTRCDVLGAGSRLLEIYYI